MLLFAFFISFSLFAAFVRGDYLWQTVVDETTIYDGMKGSNFQGGWVDSLGTIYFVKPSNRAVQILNSSGNTSFLIPQNSQSSTGASGPTSSVRLDGIDSIVGDTSGNLYISSLWSFIWKYDRSSGIVSRFAGATPAARSFSGDGGQATAANLNYPAGMFLDSTGILFFADSRNHRIRNINIATGIINTFAGNGVSIFAGDSGQATSASFNNPTSVWGSGDGVIYIADYGNNRIRRIDTAGIITTFAGSGTIGYNGENIPATSANINPWSIVGHSNGNIFFSEPSNCRIRMIEDGIVRTIAGNGSPGSLGSKVLTSANTPIPSPRRVVSDPLSGAIYFTTDKLANKLVIVPTQSPTYAPDFQFTEIPTITPTNLPNVPSKIPSFRPSSSPTNHNNNSTLNSDSRSSERMSDLHIFYATFFPVFFVLSCILLPVLVYVSCYKKNEEKDKGSNAKYNQNSEKSGYEKVVVERVVVKQERYYEMWF